MEPGYRKGFLLPVGSIHFLEPQYFLRERVDIHQVGDQPRIVVSYISDREDQVRGKFALHLEVPL